MIIDDLKKIAEQNSNERPQYLRSLLKEALQLYVLNFIYTSKYNSNFIFTGGTCLRICFGLPRLSEDLDFDIIDITKFEITKFTEDIQDYFVKNLQYKDVYTKIANNQRTIFIKFPILRNLGISSSSENDALFVRVDITKIPTKYYKQEISVKNISNFSFIINRYSLPDLFASKICAIIERNFSKGSNSKEEENSINIKGRDYYDLLWFLEKRVVPNYGRIGSILKIRSKDGIIKLLNDKVASVNEEHIKEDLAPFVKDLSFISDYSKKYKELYKTLLETRVDMIRVDRLIHTPLYLEMNNLRFKFPQYEDIFTNVLNNETIDDPGEMLGMLKKSAEDTKNQELINDLKKIIYL